jgi:hypothetical protein
MCEIQLEYRTGIKFLTKEANGPKVIHQRMMIVYGNEGPSLFQIRFWSEQFRWGRDSTQDDPKSGRPVEARTEMVFKNGRFGAVRSADEVDFYCQGKWSIRKYCLESFAR